MQQDNADRLIAKYEQQALSHLSGDLLAKAGVADSVEQMKAANAAARLTITTARLHGMIGMHVGWPELGSVYLKSVTSLLELISPFGEKAEKSIIGQHARQYAELSDALIQARVIQKL
jgi:hypothetical protein